MSKVPVEAKVTVPVPVATIPKLLVPASTSAIPIIVIVPPSALNRELWLAKFPKKTSCSPIFLLALLLSAVTVNVALSVNIPTAPSTKLTLFPNAFPIVADLLAVFPIFIFIDDKLGLKEELFITAPTVLSPVNSIGLTKLI